MIPHIRANLWLLFMTMVLCSLLYPLLLLSSAYVLFPHQAEGSLIRDEQGTVIGSRLVAQSFTGEQYFQPRPSATSYNGAATAGSNWGANNYLLRDRVARLLGPVVKYRSGRLVAPDVETWFQADRFAGSPGIVAQWAAAHPALAANWVKADPLHTAYVSGWKQNHPDGAAQRNADQPDHADPYPEDFAVSFFDRFSHEHPGRFPVTALLEGTAQKQIQPMGQGGDIQAIFFDMWRHDHPDADLEPVPADMVMASGSGVDPQITLRNALYQLNRVADKWAAVTRRESHTVRQEVEELLRAKSFAPLGGWAGVPLVNVLEINLALRDRYLSAVSAPGLVRDRPQTPPQTGSARLLASPSTAQ